MIRSSIQILAVFLASLFTVSTGLSQGKPNPKNLIYVDKQGVIRYTKSNTEAAFFGVNYTAPFAYGYRSIKSLGIPPEQAIDQDVYHFARLGLDAFRVHVWDVELTDSTGNLLANEHLRLFDYLLFQLKKRNIKTIITPIAFWGNGYPEKDAKTPGFSTVYGKAGATINEKAIQAQEKYIRQFFSHVNPYTNTTYEADEAIIAVELNNEPSHSGPKQKVTDYVNRLHAAVRQTGWDKPIFYNISQNPGYADAVSKTNVDGFSFQWYPTSLVSGRTLPGNVLPHVDRYQIPFDTLAGFKNKARIVYEFDAGDIMKPYMYPAMARSFRSAGFQWATQFAYDPMATAFANTEYQTHYLNLAYTPSKAISLLIAAQVFHQVPRFKSYGSYPQDTLFGPFRVSNAQALSEMNSEQAFYYANSTQSKPVNAATLRHIAGVGNSPVVQYPGFGAYFLDKLGDGIWRLEVMPDAIPVSDPFARASLKKEVTAIRWNILPMHLDLPDLGTNFRLVPQNTGNTFTTATTTGSFSIRPGTYLLTSDKAPGKQPVANPSVIGLTEFVAPAPSVKNAPTVLHTAYGEVSAGIPVQLTARIIDLEGTDKVTLALYTSTKGYQSLPMHNTAPYVYQATIPAALVKAGTINYRLLVQRTDTTFWAFPGGYTGNPYAWDYLPTATYQTYVAADQSSLVIFDPNTDHNQVVVYSADFKSNSIAYITDHQANHLSLCAMLSGGQAQPNTPLGFQFYFGDKLKGRQSELGNFTRLVVRARSGETDSLRLKISLIGADGTSFSRHLTVGRPLGDIDIPLTSLGNDSMLLLPRPYPEFQPLTFRVPSATFSMNTVEKVEVMVIPAQKQGEVNEPTELIMESIRLEK